MDARKTSYSFPIKAAFDCLPTHKREAKRQEADKTGTYTERYKDTLQGGTCKRCALRGITAIESTEHVLSQCQHPEAVHIRATAIQAIGNIWGQADTDRGKGGVEWEMHNPTVQVRPEWETWWGWLGLMPETSAVGSPGSPRRIAVRKTADRLAEAGQQLWKSRCEWMQLWNERVGINPEFFLTIKGHILGF
jgi:hypothetical protein